MKKTKYKYFKVLQGDYGSGWDDLCYYDQNDPAELAALKQNWRDYCINEPSTPHRIISRRVLVENTTIDAQVERGGLR